MHKGNLALIRLKLDLSYIDILFEHTSLKPTLTSGVTLLERSNNTKATCIINFTNSAGHFLLSSVKLNKGRLRLTNVTGLVIRRIRDTVFAVS